MKIEEIMKHCKHSYSLPGVVKSSSAFSRPTIIEIERLQKVVDDLENRIKKLTKDQ
jgi:hypothetical protein